MDDFAFGGCVLMLIGLVPLIALFVIIGTINRNVGKIKELITDVLEESRKVK